ncbi:MAG: hypothetical protein B7C55_03005 [Actinomycetales bacterium mxb001]|nr:MAG: hypothetical protein B7C55_03005 [Actinomycetales bacterium mxb001]
MKQLIAALAKAKLEFQPLKMSGFNKFNSYHYATLADIIASTNEALSKNGLVPVFTVNEEKLILTLWHESGEFLESFTTLVVDKNDKKLAYPQAWGLVLTYSKKYLLAALLGVAAEDDDDGVAATAIKKSESSSPLPSSSFLSKEQIAKLMAVAPLDANGDVPNKLKNAITGKCGLSIKINSLAEIPPDKFETILDWLPTFRLE